MFPSMIHRLWVISYNIIAIKYGLYAVAFTDCQKFVEGHQIRVDERREDVDVEQSLKKS